MAWFELLLETGHCAVVKSLWSSQEALLFIHIVVLEGTIFFSIQTTTLLHWSTRSTEILRSQSGPEVWPPNMEKSWSRGSQSQRKSEKKSRRFLEKRTWKSALLIIKMDWESFCVFSRRHYDTISPVRGRPRQIWYLFKLATLNTTSWLVVKKAVASTSFSRLWRFLCGWTSASSMNLQSMVHSTIHQWQKIWCSPWNP